MDNGIGTAKIKPIQIEMEKNIHPSTQKKRLIPYHLMKPLKAEVESLKKEGMALWDHNIQMGGSIKSK